MSENCEGLNIEQGANDFTYEIETSPINETIIIPAYTIPGIDICEICVGDCKDKVCYFWKTSCGWKGCKTKCSNSECIWWETKWCNCSSTDIPLWPEITIKLDNVVVYGTLLTGRAIYDDEEVATVPAASFTVRLSGTLNWYIEGNLIWKDNLQDVESVTIDSKAVITVKYAPIVFIYEWEGLQLELGLEKVVSICPIDNQGTLYLTPYCSVEYFGLDYRLEYTFPINFPLFS